VIAPAPQFRFACVLSAIAGVFHVKKILFLALALPLLLPLSAKAELSWLTDYKQAQQQAKENNKLLLLDFTGSDWCGWCVVLKREVFSRPQFKDYADKNLVLMEVDFPRKKVQANAVRMQNEELAQKYGIEGFPTIVVLNGEGKKVGELGYMPGGPEAFIAELEKLRKG
jgi:protein disulfide-isomerase